MSLDIAKREKERERERERDRNRKSVKDSISFLFGSFVLGVTLRNSFVPEDNFISHSEKSTTRHFYGA